MDARAIDHWDDMADHLPDYPHHVRIRARAGDSQEGAVDSGSAVRYQPRGKPDFHANPIRTTKPATGGFGYRDRLGDDYLDDVGYLEALQMGRRGPSAVFSLGVDCKCFATVDHVLELGQMILRLSQKLKTKIKAGKLTELPLDQNVYDDWSSHLFIVDRTQYIILANTASFYSCIMVGRGITDDSTYIARALETIREFTADGGQQFIFRKFIAPSAGTVSFARALNRSVTGSMNDHIHAAEFMIEDGMARVRLAID